MDKKIKLGILFKRINNTFEAEINNVLKSDDITKVQCDVLLYLGRHLDKEISQRDIEKYLGISNPTVSGILDRLENKELVERVVSKKDARYKHIVQTNKAKLLISKIVSHLDAKERQLCVGLSEEEEANLQYLLEKVLKNISH